MFAIERNALRAINRSHQDTITLPESKDTQFLYVWEKKCRCRELQIQAPTATSELAHTDKEMCKFAPVNRWRKEIA